MHIEKITPKLVVADADEAIRFYCKVFGAVPGERHDGDGRVVFAELELPGGVLLQLKDADTVDRGGAGMLLSVIVDDPDGLAEQMAAAGGEIVFEVADQPYGIRQGRVRDPFGHEWIVGAPLITG
ncbi:VOC family protein [Nocardia sp. NPDC051832]|uniref:VOC family protein n=1 Tax=Nocardia sp. NPDC051832 TaxID=3155673 RepID=UPI00344916CC